MSVARTPTTNTKLDAEESRYGHPLPADWRSRIVPDKQRPGDDRVRVTPPGIAVWALIGYLKAISPHFTADSIAQTAMDYDVSVDTVTAAVAYYEEHPEAIDARLAANAAAVA